MNGMMPGFADPSYRKAIAMSMANFKPSAPILPQEIFPVSEGTLPPEVFPVGENPPQQTDAGNMNETSWLRKLLQKGEEYPVAAPKETKIIDRPDPYAEALQQESMTLRSQSPQTGGITPEDIEITRRQKREENENPSETLRDRIVRKEKELLEMKRFLEEEQDMGETFDNDNIENITREIAEDKETLKLIKEKYAETEKQAPQAGAQPKNKE